MRDKQCKNIKEDVCSHLERAEESTRILENVLDISSALLKILTICGIHECKVSKSMDVIIYAFMHFDEVTEQPGTKLKKKIRKEDFLNDLMRDCTMNKIEAKLTYVIVKIAFKAFYHKQIVHRYDPNFFDECEWKNAASKTIEAFSEFGSPKEEIRAIGERIISIYDNYICRMKAKLAKIKEKKNKDVCIRGLLQRPCNPEIQERTDTTTVEDNLRGELCCHQVCAPGSAAPEVVCHDPCGKTFLKVVGDKVIFDPNTMEAEMKRAIKDICSTANKPPCIHEDTPLCAEFCCEMVCLPGCAFPELICKDCSGTIFLRVSGNRIQFNPKIIQGETRRIASIMCGEEIPETPVDELSEEFDTESTKDDAESTKDDAESAKDDAESAKDDAESAKDDAESAKDAAEIAKDDAESPEGDAESAKVDAESTKNPAQSAKDDTEIAKVDAENAKNDAESAKDDTKIAKDDAEIAKDDAEIVKTDAEIVKANAEIVKADAMNIKDDEGSVGSMAGREDVVSLQNATDLKDAVIVQSINIPTDYADENDSTAYDAINVRTMVSEGIPNANIPDTKSFRSADGQSLFIEVEKEKPEKVAFIVTVKLYEESPGSYGLLVHIDGFCDICSPHDKMYENISQLTLSIAEKQDYYDCTLRKDDNADGGSLGLGKQIDGQPLGINDYSQIAEQSDTSIE